jgi:ASC-1-like (ASCH) protein
MTHMHLDKIYFDYIKDCVKLYETRVYDKKRQKIKLLEIVTFHERDSKNKFKAQIVELSWFISFEDAIKPVGIKKVLPNAHSLVDGVKIYENFPHKEGNYKKGAEIYGVLRMKFKLL